MATALRFFVSVETDLSSATALETTVTLRQAMKMYDNRG
jgi:hypothetical protein